MDKYNIADKGFEIREAEVKITEILIQLNGEAWKLRYRFQMLKPEEYAIPAVLDEKEKVIGAATTGTRQAIVPQPHNSDMVYCEWDGKANPLTVALAHFKKRTEVEKIT